MKVNKSNIIAKVAKKTKTTQMFAKTFIDCFIDTIIESICEGDSVSFEKFGRFYLKPRAPIDNWHNPVTGQHSTLSEMKILRFRPAIKLKRMINGRTLKKVKPLMKKL